MTVAPAAAELLADAAAAASSSAALAWLCSQAAAALVSWACAVCRREGQGWWCVMHNWTMCHHLWCWLIDNKPDEGYVAQHHQHKISVWGPHLYGITLRLDGFAALDSLLQLCLR